MTKKEERQKWINWVKNNRKDAYTLWWWLCNPDYEKVGNELFRFHTEQGLSRKSVKHELNRRFSKAVKEIYNK